MSTTSTPPNVRTVRSSPATPVCVENASATENEYASAISVGSKMSTIFGAGVIQEFRVEDNFYVVTLENWALAQGQSPSLFLNRNAITTNASPTGSSRKQFWETPSAARHYLRSKSMNSCHLLHGDQSCDFCCALTESTAFFKCGKCGEVQLLFQKMPKTALEQGDCWSQNALLQIRNFYG